MNNHSNNTAFKERGILHNVFAALPPVRNIVDIFILFQATVEEKVLLIWFFICFQNNKAITVGNRQSFITAYLEKGLGILTYSMDKHT